MKIACNADAWDPGQMPKFFSARKIELIKRNHKNKTKLSKFTNDFPKRKLNLFCMNCLKQSSKADLLLIAPLQILQLNSVRPKWPTGGLQGELPKLLLPKQRKYK